MADCTCFVTPADTWTRYGSAVEPGSQMEPNPECRVHFPRMVRVRRARHMSRQGRHNWIVEDYRGPKVFIRSFTFSYFSAAIKNADRLARTGLIDPRACFGVERIEYPPESPCG